MANLDIRRAQQHDLPAMVAAMGQEPFFRDRLDRQRRGLGELLVAWLDGVPVGDVYLWREAPYEEPVRRHLGQVPTLNHLEVLAGHRGHGIGTALVAAAERVAVGHGYLRLGLGVGVDNPGARRLYERLGYREWEHGIVAVEWDEPDERGVSRHHELSCHWLLRDLDTPFPGLDAWRPWEPLEAAERINQAGLGDLPWYVAGGWAVDLHLERRTRPHEDLEVAIPRREFDRWRVGLTGFDWYDVGAGRVRPLAAHEQPDPANHQVWLCEPAPGVWRMDTFLEPRDATMWVSHRDGRVRVPMVDAVARDRSGIPYLRPQFLLLSKAKHRRPKDEADLAELLPALDGSARRWLAGALATVHPGHPWIRRVLRG